MKKKLLLATACTLALSLPTWSAEPRKLTRPEFCPINQANENDGVSFENGRDFVDLDVDVRNSAATLEITVYALCR